MSLRTARVVAVHAEDNSVDIVMHDDNSRHLAVQVLAIGATTNTGLVDLPTPETTSNEWGQSERTTRDAIAVCAMLGGTPIPVVVGFLYPQVNGMLFGRKNFRVQRHASDWYTTVDDNGNFEASHPSGTYFRIAEASAHENLTGQDFDKKWKIARNTSKAVHVHLTVANAGAVKCTLNIDPSGNITLDHTGNLTTQTDGAAAITVDGNAAVTVGGNATMGVSGSTTVTSNGFTVNSSAITLNGAVQVTNGLNISGGGVTHQGTNIGKTHTHGGVSSGSSHTAVVD